MRSRSVLTVLFLLVIQLHLVSVAASAATWEVRILQHSFSPKNLNVKEGDTVRWVWQSDNHDVVSGLPYEPNGFFASSLENIGFNYEITFDREFLKEFPINGNRYDYYCTPHAPMGMVGSVTVARQQKQLKASPSHWQTIPRQNGAETADCSIVMNASETQVSITCNHSLSNATGLSFNTGRLGSNGKEVCSFSGSSFSNRICPITPAIADSVLLGESYLLLHASSAPSIRGQIHLATGSSQVRGQIKRDDGTTMPNVRVRVGNLSTLTNDQGNFLFSSIPNGVYEVRSDKAGFSFKSSPGIILVNSQQSVVTSVLASGNSGLNLNSPVRALWNGFLSMINILEIINKGAKPMPVELKLYAIDGSLKHTQSFSIPANGQQDIIVNDLPGFQANSYGLIELSFAKEFSQIIDGRMSSYRLHPTPGRYEFAFAVPFVNPLVGDSALGFNTFQPSLNPTDRDFEVAQWLSLVNIDQNEAQAFTVERYDQNGILLLSNDYVVPAKGRVDFEAGHMNPGPQTVGSHAILPQNKSVPYLAFLYRYGSLSPNGSPEAGYAFAFPLLAAAGSEDPQYVSISRLKNAENWVELLNPKGQQAQANVQIFNSSGILQGQEEIVLGPYAQKHIFAGQFLAAEESGSMHILPSAGSRLLGQSMFYFRNEDDGSILGMYGKAFGSNLPAQFYGSYNRFLEINNILRLANTLNRSTRVGLRVFSGNGESFQQFELAPQETIDVSLSEDRFGTEANTYGQFSLGAEEIESVLPELLRLREADGKVDFAMPTEVR